MSSSSSSSSTVANKGSGSGSTNSTNANNGHHQYDQKWIVAMAEEGSPFVRNSSSSTTATATVTATATDSAGKNSNKNNNNLVCLLKSFPDPSSTTTTSSGGEKRQYAVTGGDYNIIEFQSLETDFGSYLVGRHVVEDSTLYTTNRVDPLFFVLATQSAPPLPSPSQQQQQQQQNKQESKSSSTTKQQWQPIEQFLSSTNVAHEIQKSVRLVSKRRNSSESSSANENNQLMHLCDSISDNEMIFLKFNPTKALKWLRKKQECVLDCLMSQVIEQQKQKQEHRLQQRKKQKLSSSSNDATSSTSATTAKASASNTFNIPIQPELESETKPKTTTTDAKTTDDATTKASSSSSSSSKEQSPCTISGVRKEQLKADSIEIVCEYLNNDWTKAFMDHLGWKTPSAASESKPTAGAVAAAAASGTSTPSNNKSQNHLHRTVTPAAGDSFSSSSSFSSNSVQTSSSSSMMKKKAESAQTVANKRLAKVKTKGMKSISSFFGAAPSKKK